MIYIKRGYECLKLLSPFLVIYLLVMMMILSEDTARQNLKTTGKKSTTALQANQFKIIGEFN